MELKKYNLEQNTFIYGQERNLAQYQYIFR